MFKSLEAAVVGTNNKASSQPRVTRGMVDQWLRTGGGAAEANVHLDAQGITSERDARAVVSLLFLLKAPLSTVSGSDSIAAGRLLLRFFEA